MKLCPLFLKPGESFQISVFFSKSSMSTLKFPAFLCFLFLSSPEGIFSFIWGKGRRRERRERESEREREKREKHWLVAFHRWPDWGSNPHPRYVPWPGIKPVTFLFMGGCSKQLSYSSQGSKPLLLRLVNFQTFFPSIGSQKSDKYR